MSGHYIAILKHELNTLELRDEEPLVQKMVK